MGALASILTRLRPVRGPLLALALLATLAAVLVGYRPSLGPPGLHPRSSGLGVAQADVLVDTRASQLAGIEPQEGSGSDKLSAELAVSYSLYLQSNPVTAALGRALGLHDRSIAASGPFTLLLGRENIAAKRPTPPNPIVVDHSYRLLLDVDGERPTLSIYAQAPTAAAAIAMVDAARGLLIAHVNARQANGGGSVVLRTLGPATGGVVGASGRWQAMALVFALVVLLGGSLVYARRRRPTAAASRTLDPLDGVQPLDAWPHTKRILPWALAVFVTTLFIVPFDAIDLPVKLPLSSTLDRPLLIALAALWLLSLAVLSGEARPRLKLTRVHFAALCFLAICCLGVALDGSALASMDEVSLVIKKLALLLSYIVFFFVVASVVRPREVPRYAALMVVLGSIVALAAVVEYRTHYNVFYSLWGRLLPITIPSDLDAPDSIGRLTVYGPTSQPLELAALLAMVLPFAVIGSIDSGDRRKRLLYTIAIGLLLAGGLATSRKTSIVAPVGAILLLVAYRPRVIVRSLLGLALVLGVMVHFTSPGALGSVLTQLEPGHVNNVLSTTDRTARYDAVRPDVLSHLLLGRGYESYDPHKYRILDNEYLGLLITTGALGLIAYLAIFATMMTAAHRTIRGPDPRRASLALAAFASVGVIALASGLFDVLSFPHVPYLLFFVGAMILALRERSPRTLARTRRSRALPHQMLTKHAIPTPRAARIALALVALLVSSLALIAVGRPGSASAAEVSCPNSNPIVNENNCAGEGTTENQAALENYSEDLGAFTPQTSYNLGESIPVKIGTDLPSFPGTNVNISVYRIGYYGGQGARLIAGAGATNVKVSNSFQCNQENTTTGELNCSNWSVSYTIPGSKLPVSGIYEAVITDVADGGIANYVVFPVRNDARASNVLYVLPSADYEAYNTWGCKSLYYDACGGANTIAGDGRAVAVSFDRPQREGDQQYNHFFGPDYLTVFWLEQQGYDVTYTADVDLDSNAAALLNHKVDLVSGHSEYWSHNEFVNFKAARDAGVSVVSLSANTAYWQTRYENDHRTLVCYKTIQGSSNGNGGATPNDPASIGPSGEALPQFATTTRRDPGAPAGDPNAPPGGRIGPNEPENSLFGVMYVGDNDSERFKLTIPAGNANGEFASSRAFRNTGISKTSSTTLPEGIVGWEWDQIPTQPGYLAQEPVGVKKLTLTNVGDPEDSWLQDAGRARANTPPPGEPSNVSAVEYRAPSGALVFATGTMEWAYAFDTEPVIDQMTYNVLSEMGARPGTPAEDVKTDAPGEPQPPRPSFTATPTTVLAGQSVSFDASSSTDPGSTITDYKWDLDNSGKFETDTGSSPTLTHTFSKPGAYEVILKVTGSNGQQETTERTVNVENTASAKLSAAMNPVGAGQKDVLSAAGSSAIDGSIVDYKWDLDGNGTFETDTGSNTTIEKTFATTGNYTIGLQVTDSRGDTATATLTIKVIAQGVSRYADAVQAVPSLLHYYRFDASSGNTLADSKGASPGTLFEPGLGAQGAVNGDPDTATSFAGDGDPVEGETGSFGEIPMDLSSQTSITVEFWLKWNAYGNNDALAMELTSNYNEHLGGFIVDPNAGEFGGTFGVGIGAGSSRNTVFFARPSAGAWHHYAFVINANAPAASEITPYVDGQPVSYQKESSGTGAGAFASSTLYLFCRGGASLFGSGAMDELAIYSGELGAATIQEQFNSNGSEPRPVASFSNTPSLPHAGQSFTLDGSSSHYGNGSIVKYEWDLNGDGSYEINTGTKAQTTLSFATPGAYTVGLRVTDSDGATATSTRQIKVGDFPPEAKVKATPNPALTGQALTLDASESSDQGTITDYKWDLDNSGKFETDTGSTPTATTSFQTIGTHTVGVRMTDSQGLSTTTTVSVLVLEQGVSDYEDAVLGTSGLLHYYKLGEPVGPTVHDSQGTSDGAVSGASFGQPGAVAQDPTSSISFNGSSDYGAIPLDLSGQNKLTIEFWLKWSQYANNDALAMEFTPNFNENQGGFIVDPNAGEFGGTFGIGIGGSSDRNSIFFTRPSAGVWHHYAIVIDTTAPSASEITPYVDGQPVTYQQEGASTGQGAFANSTLYLLSRDGSALFGAGSLDQLAIYGQPLGAGTILQHYSSHGTNRPPSASFTLSANPVRPNEEVTLDASASSDPNGGIVDYQWDLNGNGTYETDTGSNPILKTSIANAGSFNVGLRVIDDHNASAATTRSLTVGNLPPSIKVKVSPNPVIVGQPFTLDASGSTDQGAIVDYKWDLDESGQFATDTGGNPTDTASLQTPGVHTIGVEATDDHGVSARSTVSVTVLEQAAANYSQAVLSTPGLIDYYQLDEPQGPTLLDSAGVAAGTSAGAGFGAPGPVALSTSASFNGSSAYGAIPLDLSGQNKLTIEFWLKWSQYANNDALAMEFTPNFNENQGGFIVDPNAGEFGGTFGIGIGGSSDRNSIFFTRPSAGVWHHYAIVIDTTAPTGEITPYVDGLPVSYQQESNASGQGNFANSTLYLFSRGGASLFGSGSLDNLAVYNQPLTATTVFSHYHSRDVNLSLTPSLAIAPAQPVTGQSVNFDASASTDTQGTITDYRWDLDGSGNYATDSGASPTITHTFSTPGAYVIGLRTTDSNGVVARTTRVLTVAVAPPSTPVLTLSSATGNTYVAGATVYTNPQAGDSGSFKLTASTSDPLAGIREVVLPTLTGFSAGGGALTSAPYQSTYTWSGAGASASGPQTVTAYNNAGVSASSRFEVAPDTTAPSGGALNINGVAASAGGSSSYSINGSYPIAIRTDYGEQQTSTQSGLRSSTLTLATATVSNNVCGAFGAPTTIVGAPAQVEPTGCYRYTLTGLDNVGNLASVSTTVTVDTTPPTTPSLSFSGLSANTYYKASGNTLYFRPAAGGAFTVTASSSDPQTGIRGYTFSSLAASGFGEAQSAGQMTYSFGASATQPPAAPTIFAASNAGGSSANATYALLADTTPPTGGALTVNNLAATSAGSTSFSTSGSFSIGTRADYNADAGSGLVSSVLTRSTGTLAAGSCSGFGTPVTLVGAPSQTGLAAGCYRYTLTGTDRVGNLATLTTTVEVDRTAPAATVNVPAYANGPVSVAFSASDSGSGVKTSSGQLRRASQTYSASSDSCSGFAFFSNVGSTGLSSPFTDTTVSSGHCYEYQYTVSDFAGNSTTSATATVRVDTTRPTLTGISDTTAGSTAGKPQVGDAITLTFSNVMSAASVPSSVTLTYSRSPSGPTQIVVSGIGSGEWSAGDTGGARYSNIGGTNAVVTASTSVSATNIKLTVTSISDPSAKLTAGGPDAVKGVLNSGLRDAFGNTASSSAFTTGSVRLF